MFDAIRLYFARLFDRELDGILATFAKMDAQLERYIEDKRQKAGQTAAAASALQNQSDQHLNDAANAARIKGNIRANIL